MQRISKFMATLRTTKRQRRSVHYFRKYTVGQKLKLKDELKNTSLA